MRTFREFTVQRLFEEEMYKDEDIVNFMPPDVEQAIGQITDDNLLQAIVAQVKKEAEQAYQDFISRKSPQRPNVDAIWRKYANVKSMRDLQAAAQGGNAAPMVGAARSLTPVNEEREKEAFYNALRQKFIWMFENGGQRPIPPAIRRFLDIDKRNFAIITANNFENLMGPGEGGHPEPQKPFYNSNMGVLVSPGYKFLRHRDWEDLMKSIINRTPLATLSKTIKV